MKKLIDKFVQLPNWMHTPLWKILHQLILRFDKPNKNVFLNYGYAGDDKEFEHFKLLAEQEEFRYPIQLYTHVSHEHKFPGTDVLEVGSGRGGGAFFLASTFKPKSYTALDLNPKTIAFCNKVHKTQGLKFIVGDAQKLPFENATFDAVINVESSRCYPNISAFFKETYRVLKPGGKFYYTDMITQKDYHTIKDKLVQAGFKIDSEKDIRENVVKALEADTQNRKLQIDAQVPEVFRNFFYEFAGIKGTRRFQIFETGEMGYWSFVLSKK